MDLCTMQTTYNGISVSETVVLRAHECCRTSLTAFMMRVRKKLVWFRQTTHGLTARKLAVIISLVALTILIVTLRHPGLEMKNNFGKKETFVITNIDPALKKAAFEKWDLILFSYMRSGSSVTSKALRDAKAGTFFWFEPLIPLAPYEFFRYNKKCKFRSPFCNLSTPSNDEIANQLEHIYKCRTEKLFPAIIERAIKVNKSGWTLCTDPDRKCTSLLNALCMQAAHRVTKILRIGLDIGLKLLERIPKLKIVYLVRDPRGVLFSRIMTAWFPVFENDTETLINNIVTHCDKMRTDLLKMKEIEYLYPDRIMTVYFEEIAQDHFKAFKKIYNFINLTYHIRDKVNMDQMFANMSQSNHKWRWSMNWTYVQWVDELCSDTYSRLGYVIIPSEDTLRNMSVKSWTRPFEPKHFSLNA